MIRTTKYAPKADQLLDAYSDAYNAYHSLSWNDREAKDKALMQTDEFKALKAEVIAFEECLTKPDYVLGEDGSLLSRQRLYLDRSLCTDEDGNPDVELAEELLRECSENLYFHQDDYSQGYFEWVMEQSHGEPCIVNYPPDRNHYAVYCRDLGLEVNSIKSEEHGLMLVEQAVRSHGYFPDIGSVDQCGFFTHIAIPAEIAKATDAELDAMISKVENEDSE